MRPSLFRLWSLWNSALTLPSCEIPDLLTWWWNRKTFLDTFCTLLYQCRWVQLPSFQWNFAISQLWQCWRGDTGSQALRFNHKVKLLLHPHCQKWPDNRKIEVKNRNTEVFDVNFGRFRYFDITPSTWLHWHYTRNIDRPPRPSSPRRSWSPWPWRNFGQAQPRRTKPSGETLLANPNSPATAANLPGNQKISRSMNHGHIFNISIDKFIKWSVCSKIYTWAHWICSKNSLCCDPVPRFDSQGLPHSRHLQDTTGFPSRVQTTNVGKKRSRIRCPICIHLLHFITCKL